MLPPQGSSENARARERRLEPLPPLVSAALEPGEPSLAARLARIAAHSGGRARYTVLGEVAQGGMGRILRAWDESLAREVAMKVVPREPGSASSDEEKADHERRLSRFIDEARITGQLDHPGIVPVYEVGLDAEGRVFFTMPLVRGQDLKQVFARVYRGEEGWTLQRAVGVLHTVCLTVAFAHQKGVVHRDLKPENVMVGPFGEAYVLDWGLALLVGRVERTGIVGTPAYMSPEQAAGHSTEVGPRSDVYSLGALLYELLARRMPHEHSLETRAHEHDSFEQVLATPPRPLSALDEGVPAELAAIAAKAMALDPRARYASALEMADDLAAWLEGHVVSVQPAGRWTRLRKWRARNRALAFALDAIAVLLLVGAAAFTLQQRVWLREVRAKHEEVRLAAYAAGLSAADLGLRAHETAESRRRLEACDPRLRGWEWHHLALRADASARVLSGHAGAVRSVAVSPDGHTLASASDDGSVILWDAADGALRATLTGHTGVVTKVAWAPDGTRLASASKDKRVLLWDLAGATLERELTPHAASVVALAFSADGSVLAAGDDEGGVVLTGVSDGSLLAQREPEERNGLVALEFVPGTGVLAAAYLSGTLRLLEPETLAVRQEAQVARSALTSLAVDPVGALLAVAYDRQAMLLDAASLEPLHPLPGHGSRINGLAFSPEGARLATASYDNVLRVFELESGRVQELEGHDDDVNSVAFCPDGRHLVTGSEDHSLRVWELARAPVMELLELGKNWIDSLAFAPDGHSLAAGAHDRVLRVLGLDGREHARLETDGIVDCVAWGSARRLFYGCGEPVVRSAAADTLVNGEELTLGKGSPRALVLDPRGQRLFVRDSQGVVSVLALASGARLAELSTHGDESATLALSPDGQLLAAGTTSGELLLWDARTLAPRTPWRAGKATVSALAFAPDGKRLAVGGQNRSISLLDGVSGALEHVLDGHENIVSCLAFSPDGKRLVSGAYDHTLRVWSPEEEVSLLTLRGHTDGVTAVAFDPSGEILASASKDGTLRLWRTARAFESPMDEPPAHAPSK